MDRRDLVWAVPALGLTLGGCSAAAITNAGSAVSVALTDLENVVTLAGQVGPLVAGLAVMAGLPVPAALLAAAPGIAAGADALIEQTKTILAEAVELAAQIQVTAARPAAIPNTTAIATAKAAS